jgi:hypothetical protein
LAGILGALGEQITDRNPPLPKTDFFDLQSSNEHFQIFEHCDDPAVMSRPPTPLGRSQYPQSPKTAT